MRHLTGITGLPVFSTIVFMAFFFPAFFTLSEAADAPNNGEEKTGKHRVVIVTDPYKSMVEILDSSVAYTPGVALPDGKYKIRVSHVGYVSETGSMVVDGRDVSALVILKELPTPEGGADGLLGVKQTLNEAVALLEREKRAVEREKQKIAEEWRQIQAARQVSAPGASGASGGAAPLANEGVGRGGSNQAEKLPDIGAMVLAENHDFVDLTPMEETVAQPSRQESLVLLPVHDVKTEVAAPKAPPGPDSSSPPKSSYHDGHFKYGDVYAHTEKLRMRRAANRNAEVVKELPLNTRLRVLDAKNGWLHVVSPDDDDGWVAEFLVKDHLSGRREAAPVGVSSPAPATDTVPSKAEGAAADKGELTAEASQWYVQTTFYWDLELATNEVTLLQGKGFKALAVNKKFPSGKDGFFVRIGGFESRAEAQSAMDRFHDQFGKEGMLVKPKQ